MKQGNDCDKSHRLEKLLKHLQWSTKKGRKISTCKQRLYVGFPISDGLCKIKYQSQPLTSILLKLLRAPSAAVKSAPVLLINTRVKLCSWDSPSLIHLAWYMKTARSRFKDCIPRLFSLLCIKLYKKTLQRRLEIEQQVQELLKSHPGLASPSHSSEIVSRNDFLQRNELFSAAWAFIPLGRLFHNLHYLISSNSLATV